MSENAYDDGDGRWDVEHTCDSCGVTSWSATERGSGWQTDTHVQDHDGKDYCPDCLPRPEPEDPTL